MALQKPASIKKRLGEMLVSVGVITDAQLQEAIRIQQKQGGKLGSILLAKGFITEDILLAFLGKQCGVSYVSLSEYGEIPANVIRCAPESVARHQHLIPIALEGNTLTIAMADPLNVFATDDLKLMTGYEINVVIASESEIRSAIEKYYGYGSLQEAEELSQKAIELEKPEDFASGDVSFSAIIKEAENSPDLEMVSPNASQDIVNVGFQSDDAPIVKLVNLILSRAVKAKASDIHIEPFEKSLQIRFRIDGVLHKQDAPPKKMQNALVSRLKIMAQLDIAERRLPQDGRIKIRMGKSEVDLRVSVLPTAFGEKVVMRVLDTKGLKLDLSQLGFEPEALAVYSKNLDVPHGIILVTGPTGSGKSTTLYSSLSTLNHPDVNIMTIEDPVEYVLPGINQVQAKPDIGLTFAAGLRSFLRQDPDIIMVGEIRDTETAEISINAALTGHLVFSTLHTNDAPGAVTRLNNMGIEPFLTASTVVMVIAQRLMRVVCQECKEPYEVPFEYLANCGVKPEQVKSQKTIVLHRGKGCSHCSNTGYRGRLAIYEVMEMTDEVRDLILERASSHVIKQSARKSGMMTLREAALRKVLAGTTTVEEMMRITHSDSEA